MRISDCSSDVCSSDLLNEWLGITNGELSDLGLTESVSADDPEVAELSNCRELALSGTFEARSKPKPGNITSGERSEVQPDHRISLWSGLTLELSRAATRLPLARTVRPLPGGPQDLEPRCPRAPSSLADRKSTRLTPSTYCAPRIP